MTSVEIKTVAKILTDHYQLRGTVSATEVKDEIRNLARKQAKGALDDKSGYLAASIHTATGRDVTELHKGYAS